MAIPDMPSSFHLWEGWPDPVYGAGPFPGRLVPMVWLWHGRPHVGAYASITHWLDCDIGDLNIIPAYKHSAGTTSAGYVWNSAAATVVSMCVAGRPEYFIVSAYEVRYADTPSQYTRLYLHSVGASSIPEPNPCG